MKLRKYKKLTQEEIDAIFARMPPVPAERIEEVEEAFPWYMFYETGYRERLLECSRCGKTGVIATYMEGERTWTKDLWDVAHGKHNDVVTCPGCGRRVQLKCRGRMRTRTSLNLTARLIFFVPNGRDEIFARVAFASQRWEDTTQPGIDWSWREEFCFTPGLALGRNESGSLLKSISNPFRSFMGNEPTWQAVGLEDCRDTFFGWWPHEKYYPDEKTYENSVWEPLRQCSDLLTYIAGFCEFPQCERLAKMGLVRLAGDRVFLDDGHGLRWAEQDTRKLLGLDRAELRDLIAAGGEPDTLESFRKLRRMGVRTDMKTARRVSRHGVDALERSAKAVGVTPADLWRYLDKIKVRTGCHCGGYGEASIGGKIGTYDDYVDMARAGGLDLYRDDQKFPKDLQAAHDAAMEARDRAWEARRAEQKRLEALEDQEREKIYAERYSELVQRYEVRDKPYCIIVPPTLEAIREEGQRMGHCVAGYRYRHLSGETLILFLRKSKNPEDCLYTIEIDPKTGRLRQARARHNGPLAPAAKTWLTGYIEGLTMAKRRKGA